jgi:hypothetical protein
MTEDCYILGDGPSIKWFDLKKLHGKPCISIGYLSFHIEAKHLNIILQTHLRRTWFIPFKKLDVGNNQKWKNSVRKLVKKEMQKNKKREYLVHFLSKLFLLQYMNVGSYVKLNHLDPEFRRRIVSELGGFPRGSIYHAIGIAIKLGFKKITLVGCDYINQEGMSGHWYENGQGIEKVRRNDANWDFYSIALEFIHIDSISLQECKGMINQVSFEEKFSTKLKYRENTEIADSNFLFMISRRPGINV